MHRPNKKSNNKNSSSNSYVFSLKRQTQMTNQKLDNIGFFEYILQTLRMQSVPKRVGRADEAENL